MEGNKKIQVADERPIEALVRPGVSVPDAANAAVLHPVKPGLLELPTRELLEKFGAGKHQPGSGSAAALAGVLSCKLLRTVLSLCRERAARYERLRLALPNLNRFDTQIIATIEPYLLSAVQTDAEQFHKVIESRKLRDAESDEQKRGVHEERALEELIIATEIPIEIAENCVLLCERGLEVFDKGYLAVRGDTGVAVSTASSAAQGALAVVFLNLTAFKTITWRKRALPLRERADRLVERVRFLQNALFTRVQKLQSEGIESPQIALEL